MDKVENLTGFVALIDVLGFREFVSRANDLSPVRQYIDTVAEQLENPPYKDSLQFVLFSDNLVINTKNAERDSLHTLIRACSELFFRLTRYHIAVRGAVAHGSFMRSPNTDQGVVVAGRPIVEADYYQHCQDWVGIMLAPSVTSVDTEALQSECGNVDKRGVNESDHEWFARNCRSIRLKKWPEIPFHTDEPGEPRRNYEGFAVCPINPDVSAPDAVLNSLKLTVRDLGLMKATAPNPASQDKYSATIKFLAEARHRMLL